MPSLQLNPIIVREMRIRMRGMRPYATLTLFLIALIGVGYGIFELMLRQAQFGVTVISAQVGQALFSGLAMCELLLIVFIAPAMASGAISSERERLTYEMLIATPLRPSSFLWGKLFSTLSYLFLLIFASIPVFSAVLLFGGVAPLAIVKTVALLTVTAITYGAVGLFASSLSRRTSRATILSYALIVTLIASTAAIGSLWGQFSFILGQQAPPQVLYLNPFSALFSIVTLAPGDFMGPFFGYSSDFYSSVPLFFALSPGVIYYGQNGPIVLPIYRATLLFYPLLTLILYWLSTHLALPRSRWRLRWSDLGFGIAFAALVATIWFTRNWWFVAPPTML